MKGKSKEIGLIAGILIVVIIQSITIPGLEGKTALALTSMTTFFGLPGCPVRFTSVCY